VSAVAEDWLLVIDTATRTVVVAAADRQGRVVDVVTFPAEHRHGSHLLPAIASLLGETRELAGLAGVVVGTGPGAFTGLRVGLATAKTLAHERRIPIVGVSTGEALLAAAAAATSAGGGEEREALRLLLPAGPRDGVSVRAGSAPEIVADLTSVALAPGDAARPEILVAVDLDGRASPEALARGRLALEGLPGALAAIGADRLAKGDLDDPERLVPVYVSLPRGVLHEVDEGAVAWSRDPR
jgi:tRNA threonylcarbamoyl adenosine modification protein YeaZ